MLVKHCTDCADGGLSFSWASFVPFKCRVFIPDGGAAEAKPCDISGVWMYMLPTLPQVSVRLHVTKSLRKPARLA